MQKEASIDDKVTYKFLKSSWSSWSYSAEKVLRVAYKLESERDTKCKELIASSNADVYYMLIGFALENYLKGAIVQNLLISGESLDEDKLERVLDRHNIWELFSKAGLEVQNKVYNSYLDHLTKCIEWRGRYPFPVKAKHIGGSIKYSPPKEADKYRIVVELQHTIPIDVIHELVDMAKKNLEDIKQKVKAKEL